MVGINLRGSIKLVILRGKGVVPYGALPIYANNLARGEPMPTSQSDIFNAATMCVHA